MNTPLSNLTTVNIENIGNQLLEAEVEEASKIKAAYELSISDPELVIKLFIAYGQIIKALSNISSIDLEIIQTANKLKGSSNSASHHSAVDFLTSINKFDILNLNAVYYSLSNPNSEFYEKTLEVLAEMMHNGYLMKLEGKTPKDGDPESDRSIYGHTQLTDPAMLIQFTICHLMERYFSEVFKKKELEMAFGKDWFLNVITDVMALMLAKGEVVNSRILYAWKLPRKEGGLGWLSSERSQAYKDATALFPASI